MQRRVVFVCVLGLQVLIHPNEFQENKDLNECGSVLLRTSTYRSDCVFPSQKVFSKKKKELQPVGFQVIAESIRVEYLNLILMERSLDPNSSMLLLASPTI
ncbi:hypothetical protein PGT21_024491 [Puccinia graminis f. sp. tritici]|uniref:Uncharacterized protein n=1 Tax=Puccinia graminis f. sp. tritici TaxID=56615 RepID=A0A5B0MUI8_PUCGR|nr:hypothetical protein PGT21_024491 [Puccinia graminis f. sp. tritici]